MISKWEYTVPNISVKKRKIICPSFSSSWRFITQWLQYQYRPFGKTGDSTSNYPCVYSYYTCIHYQPQVNERGHTYSMYNRDCRETDTGIHNICHYCTIWTPTSHSVACNPVSEKMLYKFCFSTEIFGISVYFSHI